MGKRSRRRTKLGTSAAAGVGGATSFADLGIDLDLEAADAASEASRDLGPHGVLTLRTGMSPGTRREYDALLKGDRSTAASTQEDRWARALEFLFERLVVRWEIAGVDTTGPKDLLRRFRLAGTEERKAVREALGKHLAEHLPEVQGP